MGQNSNCILLISRAKSPQFGEQEKVFYEYPPDRYVPNFSLAISLKGEQSHPLADNLRMSARQPPPLQNALLAGHSYFQNIFENALTEISKSPRGSYRNIVLLNFLQGLVRALSCPPLEKGLLPEEGSYLMFQWIYFWGLLQEFPVRAGPQGTYQIKLLSNYFGNDLAGGTRRRTNDREKFSCWESSSRLQVGS